jgi:type VI secretion system secreted protein VgrG
MRKNDQGVIYELTIEGLSEELMVFTVDYEGALSDPYKLTVKVAIKELRKKGVQEVTEEMRGKNASLRMWRDTPDKITEEFIRGLVLAVHREGRFNAVDEIGEQEKWIAEHQDTFVVEIVPALEFLKFEVDKPRTWHNQTYKKVLKEVLEPGLSKYGREYRDQIKRDDIIDIITQVPYESDLEFVMNLCTEAGINAFFDHSGDKEVLILSDENDAFLKGTTYQTIPLRVGRNMSGSLGEWISHFQTRTDSDINEVKQKCFDQVESPSQLFDKFEFNPSGFGFSGALNAVLGALGLGGAMGGGGGGGGGGLDTGVLQKWQALRPNEVGDKELQFKKAAENDASRLQTNLLRNDARTGVIGMLEGKTFDVEAQPDDTRKYVVERVKFSGQRHGGIFGPDGRPADYNNNATVVPLTTKKGEPVKVRATKQQEPRRMKGLSLAEIVGLEAHPVEVDKLMRVRFRYLWDEKGTTPQETWCMVMQPMAGRFGGNQYIPREGDRVLIAFVEGNRNVAVIVGGFYDDEFRPPYLGPPQSITLPESDLLLGFSYSSIERGKKPAEQGSLDRQSMMSIDVTANEEMFFFNAPWDWRQDIGNDCEINIEHDRRETIKNDETLKIDGKFDETVGKDKTENYQQNLVTTVGKNVTTSVGENLTTTVEGKVMMSSLKTTTIQDPELITLTADKIKLDGHTSGGMGASPNALFELSRNVRIEAPEWVRTETGATRLETFPERIELETPGAVDVSAGQGRVRVDSQAFDVESAKVEHRDAAGGRTTLTNGSYVVDVPQGITFRCGSTELRLSPEGVFINGQQVRIDGRTVEIQAERVDVTGDRNDG